ncbi:MFS general substrate transporter [Aspergillus japonicus CBS 114.51]|uniref:MFS general substrate transporter n=1 Tax=Aspergillus japonicus CBS 114.51 TaxID=1448312 RepID=A0A8T8XHK2_ASPJA|nr:MFS general substrate transporter [Aspergillus japonicus CBS 114.51]RAH87388.1 MFS general substrate transporter [Aspergillus japonicus CBS 114.51]
MDGKSESQGYHSAAGNDEAICGQPLVDYYETNPDNPRNWSKTWRWSIVVLVACLCAEVQLCTIIAAPVSPQILTFFHSKNLLYRTLLVTIWELGEILAPLVWGPLSELYGRRWILNGANLLFIVFLAGTALSTSIQMLIAFRFLSGLATACIPIGPGIMKDLFRKEQRGRAMSVMSLTSVVGPVVGPIMGSYLGERAGWRWVFWLPTLLSGALGVLILVLYRETYKLTILKRKAATLQQDTRAATHHTAPSPPHRIPHKNALILHRPLTLLIHSPALALATLHLSIIYGLTYLVMTTIAPVFEDLYSFSEGASGLAFLGLCLGFTLGALLCSLLLDRYITRRRSNSSTHASQTPTSTPEQRLPPLFLGCLLTFAGLLLFGWSVHYRIYFLVPVVGTAMVGLGLAATSITVQTYVVDSFGACAVSAISALMVVRNVTAAVVPLAGPPLFRAVGYGWGGTVLAGVGLLVVPVPGVLVRFGGRWRYGPLLQDK